MNQYGSLEDLKEKINNSDESGALDSSNAILKRWGEIDEVWSTLIPHNELDTIMLSMLKLKSNVETKMLNDALEEIDKTVFLVGHIKNKVALEIKNIF